jgi:hypothetical protein
MNENLATAAKRTGSVLVDISDTLSAKMERWSDVPQRPNRLSTTECVGFINKEDTSTQLSLVLDIQAPDNADKATLRVWAIKSESASNGNELFNNIQLDFAMEYAAARVYTQKAEAITRDDIRAALREPHTRLAHLVVSDNSGVDTASQQSLGMRYDVTSEQLDEDTSNKVAAALQAVVSRIKNSTVA